MLIASASEHGVPVHATVELIPLTSELFSSTQYENSISLISVGSWTQCQRNVIGWFREKLGIVYKTILNASIQIVYHFASLFTRSAT